MWDQGYCVIVEHKLIPATHGPSSILPDRRSKPRRLRTFEHFPRLNPMSAVPKITTFATSLQFRLFARSDRLSEVLRTLSSTETPFLRV
jgi:hypothetical protein